MRILVCGAHGFIGSAICDRLQQAGYIIIKGVRKASLKNEMEINFSADITEHVWINRLHQIDAVINAVGILVEQSDQKFSNIHTLAPIALFAACAKVGIKRVLQVSALGAEQCDTPYFQSKLHADRFLQEQKLEWQIIRPSVVYGDNADSSKMFRLLASLPILPLPAGGKQILQPVHIDDLTEGVLQLMDQSSDIHQIIPVVGNRTVSYREMLEIYGHAMGFSKPFIFPVPGWLVSLAAIALEIIPGSMLTRDTWKMFNQGSYADQRMFTKLLDRPPQDISHFISPSLARTLRVFALKQWRIPALLSIVATLCIGIVIYLA